jgi:hypothetical protein
MKKYIITICALLICLKLSAQHTNLSQFVVGLSYGIPIGEQSKQLNNNILKLNIGQEFALNKIFSMIALGDFVTTSGANTNPNINKIGLGGGLKIQIIPLVNLIRKNKLETKSNIYVSSNGSININNIKNYANSGEMFDLNVVTGVEFFGKKNRIYKVYFANDFFFTDFINVNLRNSENRAFSQIGFAIGINNSKKK